MKTLFSLAIVATVTLFSPSVGWAGNLEMIEKRLLELDKLNKAAVRQSGDLPADGSVSLRAKVTPKKSFVGESATKTPPPQFDFEEITTLSIDRKQPFTVQISASRSQQRSYRVAVLLQKAGYPAFTGTVRLADTGVWHRIFVGAFETRKAAAEILKKLEDKQITDGLVRSMPYAVEVDGNGSMDPKKRIERLRQMQFLPYTTKVRDTRTGAALTRVLIGAFDKKEGGADLLARIQKQGLQARMVNR